MAAFPTSPSTSDHYHQPALASVVSELGREKGTTVNLTKSESTSMNTEIQTVGNAILIQTLIRYAAYIVIAWLPLSFADGWVTAYLTTP